MAGLFLFVFLFSFTCEAAFIRRVDRPGGPGQPCLCLQVTLAIGWGDLVFNDLVFHLPEARMLIQGSKARAGTANSLRM